MTIIRSCFIILIMKASYQDMVDFIIQVGLYPAFIGFCTATPYIKSKRRKAYLFLVQKSKWYLFKACYGLSITFDRAKEVCSYELY